MLPSIIVTCTPYPHYSHFWLAPLCTLLLMYCVAIYNCNLHPTSSIFAFLVSATLYSSYSCTLLPSIIVTCTPYPHYSHFWLAPLCTLLLMCCVAIYNCNLHPTSSIFAFLVSATLYSSYSCTVLPSIIVTCTLYPPLGVQFD